MIRQTGSKLVALIRSLVFVGVLVVLVPVALIAVARARFGGGAPLHGVPAPSDWEAVRIKAALTDRLTEQTVADIVIRLSLIVAWVALLVLVVTIVAELVHMVRHDGLALPDIRGLGMSQSVARVIAAGLLVVVPMFQSPNRAVASEGGQLVPEQRTVAESTVESDSTPVVRPDNVWVSRQAPGQRDSVGSGRADTGHSDVAPAPPSSTIVEPGQYVVRAGDSIYGIAARLAGPDRAAIADYAEQLIDLNLGTVMSDGQRFTNAAFIDVGWVLELPSASTPADASAVSDRHVVERGESLWSIAEDQLDDGTRWPEIYEANEGRSFDDGRRLVDPDLIQPGWDLVVPSAGAVDASVDPTTADGSASADDPMIDSEVVETSSRPQNVWVSTNLPPVPTPAVVVDAPTTVDDVELGPLPASSLPAEIGTDAAATSAPGDRGRSAETRSSDLDPADAGAETDRFELLSMTQAAMLSAGVLTLLAVRRRHQLRRARPRARLPVPGERPATTERALRAIDTGDRLDRVDVSVRSAASSLIDQGQRVLAALVNAEGDVELRLSGPAILPPPWHGTADVWQLDGITPVELLAEAGSVGSPCPTMVQLGRDPDDRDVYVDLEACEAIEVGGPADQADAIVAAVATTLAGSVLAEVTTLIGLGVPDAAFLGHRLHVPALDSQRAFEAAREAVGSTATADRSTFELRSRAVTGEVWEPAVVLIGSTAGTITAPDLRTGVAVVSASPIHGPSSRLAPDGDAWTLMPLGLRLLPIGLSPDDIAAIAELVEVTEPVADAVEAFGSAPDDTIVEAHDSVRLESAEPAEPVESVAGFESPDPVDAQPSWQLMVRLLGPVEVVSSDGTPVTFERSKTRELVAWLATHRRRSTRSAARTALWELDVRDATFANVVSEARRSLARLVEPPEGDEWVGRTMTEDLPLHDLVCTDADLVEQALAVARLQPPAQAIATLSPAVELISGMPFKGTAYLWPDPEGITSNLVLLATSAAAELAAHCLSIGDINGVFAATGRGLSVLPGHEELIGLRMQAHARAGDHAGVRQEWESYERVITSDPWSDGEPSPKLVDLRRQLLNPNR